MYFTTISIIKVHNNLQVNRFGFSSWIVFVSHIINYLKINVNSFIRNNVESGSRVFTLWVMQLHNIGTFHRRATQRWSEVSFYSNTEDAAASLQKDQLQISHVLNVQHLRPICPLAWEIVAYICWKRWFMFSALETFALQWWLQKTVCVILKVHDKILWSAHNSESF